MLITDLHHASRRLLDRVLLIDFDAPARATDRPFPLVRFLCLREVVRLS
jgi:hypothetical protein